MLKSDLYLHGNKKHYITGIHHEAKSYILFFGKI